MPLPAADPVCLGVTLMALWQYTSIYNLYHNHQYPHYINILYIELHPQVAPLPPRRPVLQDVPLQFHLPKKDAKSK